MSDEQSGAGVGQFERGTNHGGPAVYECTSCGEKMEFHPDEFRRLHWLKHRFGFGNVSEAISGNRRCCPHPEYMETSGYPGGEPNVK